MSNLFPLVMFIFFVWMLSIGLRKHDGLVTGGSALLLVVLGADLLGAF